MREKMGAELYLRLACERMLVSDEHNGMPGGELGVVARALVTGGLLPENEVRGVLEEYANAMRARTMHLPPHLMRLHRPERPVELLPCRVVVGPFVVPQGGPSQMLSRMLLQEARFKDDSTELDLSGTDPTLRRAHHRHPPSQPRAFSQSIRVQDDRGQSATAQSRGGGWGNTEWQATFKTDKPLWPGTRWLELNGARVDLPPPPAPPDVRVEPVEVLPALRWALYVAMSGAFNFPRGQSGSVAATVGTFVALGALESDDPLVAEAEAVSQALEQRTPKKGLPEPWPELTRRLGKADGPEGHLPIAAVCQVDGIWLRIDSLSSEAESFSVAVTASPGEVFLRGGPFHQIGPTTVQLLWWAEDDRHNLYFGTGFSGRGGSPNQADGTVDFPAPLDPRAHELRLMPTGRSERAVITLRTEGLGAQK